MRAWLAVEVCLGERVVLVWVFLDHTLCPRGLLLYEVFGIPRGSLAVGRDPSAFVQWGGFLWPRSLQPCVSHIHPASRPAGAPEAPILVVGNKRDRQRLRFGPRRALATLVRRGWRCGYLECSAKYNWHVLRLFRELLRCALVRTRPAHPALRLQGALHPARCSLM